MTADLVARAATWARAEHARIQVDPRQRWSSRLVDVALRRRLLLLGVLAGFVGGYFQAAAPTGDRALFSAAGRTITSGAWADVFGDPRLQLGPVYLAAVGVLERVADVVGLSSAALAGAATSALCVLGSVLVSRRAADGRGGALADVVVGCLVALGVVPLLAVTAHSEEALVVVALLWAAESTRRGSRVGAGVVVGLAAATKAWGLLGVPVLLRRDDPRGTLVRWCIAALTVTVAYLPFLLAGSVRSQDYTWQVSRESAIALLFPDPTSFGWPLRLLQGAVVLGVGIWLAWRPGTPSWAVVTGLVAVRLLLDPLALDYYWAGLTLALVVGARAVVPAARSKLLTACAAVAVLQWLLYLAPDAGRLAGAAQVVVVVLVLRVVLTTRDVAAPAVSARA